MEGPSEQDAYDVVVVGGGHNGLVAAAYLARAGLSVLVLERLPTTGGAAVSHELFPGMTARISPYAGLVGLFPERIVTELRLELQLRSRRTAAYAPTVRAGRHLGLHVEESPSQLTADSFQMLTGSFRDYDAWGSFHAELQELAAVVAPTLLQPLPTQRTMQERIAPELWRGIVEEPLGLMVEKRFEDDLVRGVVAGDALVGTFTDVHDPELHQNRTFLYHALGSGNGGWRVPVGGMGSLSESLERAVWRHGGEVATSAFVTRAETDGRTAQVTFQSGGRQHTVACTWLLGNVAPWVMELLLGENPGPRPEGAQIKVDMLLDRLPRLRSGVSPAIALAGTLHVGDGYEQLQRSFREARAGSIPDTPPGRLHCHSLTDPSVLGTLAMQGKHLFSYLGINAPARLYSGHVAAQRDETVIRVLDTLNVHLEEPLETLVSLDPEGNPCLRAQAPQDVEEALAMPGGHMFHGPLSWPWTPHRASLETPAQRWGVATARGNVLVCGAGAVRGGAVSGVGGHNAAMAVLEATGKLPSGL